MRKLLSKLFGNESSEPQAPTIKQWAQDVEIQPWLDQDDASDQVQAKLAEEKITQDQANQANTWIKDGYLHLEKVIPEDVVDQLNADCDGYWKSDAEPVEGLNFKTLVINEQDEIIPELSHTDLLKLPEEQRNFARDRGLWRIHGLHYHNKQAKAIFESQKIKDTVSFLLGSKTDPTFSIKFMRGSEQHVHQDLMVFHIHPPQFLIGVWVALEDIHPDSGPLHYWPGSQREKFFSEFNNYPQTNARTASPETKANYEKHLDEVKNKYKEIEFLPKKGDALLWHAMLLHSGSKVKDPKQTRRSFVVHYIPQGMDKTGEMVGPFNW